MNIRHSESNKSYLLLILLFGSLALVSNVQAHHSRSYTPGISKYQSINSFRHMIGYGTQTDQSHKKSHQHKHRFYHPKRYQRWHRYNDWHDNDDNNRSGVIIRYYSD
jgi:hypothetical protein